MACSPMEVILLEIPQPGYIGPMQVQHWALTVGGGKGKDAILYEFECDGAHWGKSSRCDFSKTHGFKAKRTKLGETSRTHAEIQKWVRHFHKHEIYDIVSNNCQDFVIELCDYLEVSKEGLPMKQAHKVEAAALGAAIFGLAVWAGGALRKRLRRSQEDELQEDELQEEDQLQTGLVEKHSGSRQKPQSCGIM